MTWATIAHICNDWLAFPLTAWTLSMLIRYCRNPTLSAGVHLAAVAAAGLLAKSYFLALLPVLAIFVFWAGKWKPTSLTIILTTLLAGPWYWRNLNKYGIVSGMQEARSGVSAAEILKVVLHQDWLLVTVRNARWALWTGNNSFLSFSTWTLNAILLTLLVSIILWFARRNQSWPEWVAAAYSLTFLAALGYSTVISFLYTSGAAQGPSPWYSQVVLPPLFGLAFLGCSRANTAGRILAGALVAAFGYIVVASYFVKLIPLYAGITGPARLNEIITWYTTRWPTLLVNLSSVTLAPVCVIVSLAVAVSVFAVAYATLIVFSLVSSQPIPRIWGGLVFDDKRWM